MSDWALPVPDPDGKIAEAIGAARAMAETHTRESTCRLHPDFDTVQSVLVGLAINKVRHGAFYCPCYVYQGSPELDQPMICPCEPHEAEIARRGFCDCAFFVGDIRTP